VSLIAAVGSRIDAQHSGTFETLQNVARRLLRPSINIGLSVLTAGLSQYFSSALDALSQTAGDEVKNATQQLWTAELNREEDMKSFKTLLAKVAENSGGSIVIVVDELDRCRPDYAPSVLEMIKHFFSVPKVHFVLGINACALQNSVKARYGAEIDAENYLRKFIHVSFSLPDTIGAQRDLVISKYARKLVQDMALSHAVSNRCIDLLGYVAKGRPVSLREVEKIMFKIALLPEEAHRDTKMHDLLCALLVTSVVDPDLHIRMVSGRSSQEAIRGLLAADRSKTVPPTPEQINETYDSKVAYWLAELVLLCTEEDLSDIPDLADWKDSIYVNLSDYGRRNLQPMPAMIQENWVEVFNI
jgi:hypothetical protein